MRNSGKRNKWDEYTKKYSCIIIRSMRKKNVDVIVDVERREGERNRKGG